MATPTRPPRGGNDLLRSLPRGEWRRLEPHLEPRKFELQDLLYESGRPIEKAYFLNCGVASLVRPLRDGEIIEIATVGPEGMIGIPLILGGNEMTGRALIQVPGEGFQITRKAFLKSLEATPILRQRLMRYALALLNQVSISAACNRAHIVEQRCARWLLMTHDRVEEDTFPLTQEFLAQMLGVRRPTVSLAAGMLQTAGVIRYSRGKITILDRGGLEDLACECYGAIVDEYKKVLS